MSCIMKGCPNSRHACKHLNFFKLPPTDEKRKQWLEVCKAESTLTKFPVVCADHFLPSQLYMRGSRVRLGSDAVPRPINAKTEKSAQRTSNKSDLQQKKLKKEVPITELHVRQKKSKKELLITELNVPQKMSKIEPQEFELAPDDDYDVRCGEVFVTYSGVLVFHCSPCDKRYATFFHFLKHLTTEHYKYISEDSDQNEYETTKSNSIKKLISVDNSICEEALEIKQEEDDIEDLQEFMKIQIQPTLVQGTENSFNEIEQILIEETPHCKETDIEYEELNGEEKTVDTSHVFARNDHLEDQEQPLSDAENPLKAKRKKCADEIFKCDICSKIFKSLQTLRRHARVHSSERKYKCDICGLALKHYSYIKRHMIRHTREKNEQSLLDAENPPESKIKEPTDYIFKCDICSKIFKNIRILKRHSRNVHSTEGKYKCDVCGLDLKHYSYLKNHMLRHTGEKNISCDTCSKKFYTNFELKLHLRSHTGERPFVCSSCGLAFTNSGALTVHEKIHNIEPLHRCSYCNKGFYSQYKMKVHMIVHTKERPFICTVCSASFPRKRSMLRHIDLRHKKLSNDK